MYVRQRNHGSLAGLLDGLELDEAYLLDTNNWVSHSFLHILYHRMIEITGDENAVYKMTIESKRFESLGLLDRIVRLIGNPKLVYGQAAKYNRLLKLNGDVYVHELGDSWVLLEDRYHDSAQKTRYDCDYTRAVLAAIPTMFDLPFANVEELECQVAAETYGRRFWPDRPVYGSRGCKYRVRWSCRGISSLWTRFFTRRTIHRDAVEDLLEANSRIQEKYDEVRKLASDLEAANRESVASRKQLELNAIQLEASELKYRLLAETVTDVIWTCDLRTLNFKYVSPSVERLLGYTPEETLGLKLEHLLEPESHQIAMRVLEEELDRDAEDGLDPGRSRTLEVRQRNKEGGYVWVEATMTFMRDEARRPVEVLGVTRNISERKRAEEAQRESDDRMRAVISTLPIGVMVMDATGRTVLRNGTMERIWGGTISAPVFPSSISDMDRYQGWWVATGMRLTAEDWACSRALTRGETSVSEIIDIRRFDGTRGTILNNATPLRDGNGRVNGAVVAIMDITELTRAQKALKEADRRKDEFLAMLAHELRNPLAAISSAIELLKLRGPADPMLNRTREAAVRQTAHMARLLDDLLDVSRVTQGKVTLNKRQIPLLSILESAIEASNPVMNARKHRLLVSYPREPMHVLGDQVRLSQAIGNLLQNSAKFSPPGGEVYLIVEPQDRQVRILVRDNGSGIEPELLPHVFDLFVQGNRSPDRSESGLGIGLTLVRSLVALHGGRVEAHSEGAGKGSEFRIWLPLLPITEEQVADGYGSAEETKSLRILLVDDNLDAVELMSALLESDGHEVTTALSGQAAIESAIECLPEVALIDIGMPGMDGYEVARRLKQEPKLLSTILVAVTGYGQEEDFQKSRNAGFDHHLVKPVDLGALRQILRGGTVTRKPDGRGP